MIRTFLTAPALSAFLVLTSAPAFAQTSGGGAGPGEPIQIPAAQTAAETSAPATNSIATPFKISAPEFGKFKLRAGLKSQNTTGRLFEYDNANGKRYQSKHEFYIGAVHTSGWGGYVQAVQSGSLYAGAMAESSRSGLRAGDPSFTLLHPDWYRGTSVTLGGQYRAYFPNSARSRDLDLYQQAYYLYTTWKMPAMWTLWNQTAPRYFIQSHYGPSDTTYAIEDLTTLSKQLSPTLSAGIGQWTQVEAHDKTATGVSVDISTFVRYTPIQNLWIEPRLLLPAYEKNSVYDAAPTASLRNARAELYAQMTL
jgi:hypothetical protein